MRLTLIIASLIFFSLLTYAKLMALAHEPDNTANWHDNPGYPPDHFPVFLQQSN